MAASQTDYESGLACANCGLFIKWMTVKTDDNGNKGRKFVSCKAKNSARQCDLFCWKAGPWQPSSSNPLTPSASQDDAETPPLPPGPDPEAAVPMAIDYAQCGQTNTGATQIVSLTVPLTQPEAGPSHVLDATPNPCFASQMAPIFYSEIEEHVCHEKEKQEQEELHKEAIFQAKHEVTVFGWGMENKPPKSVLVQEGYIYPHFQLTKAILSSVGVDASVAKLFQSTFSIWSRISNNHVVSVDESPAVFVYNTGIENSYVNKKRRAPDSDGEVGVVDVKDKGCAPVFESDAEDSLTSPPQPWRKRVWRKCPSPFVFPPSLPYHLTSLSPTPPVPQLSDEEEYPEPHELFQSNCATKNKSCSPSLSSMSCAVSPIFVASSSDDSDVQLVEPVKKQSKVRWPSKFYISDVVNFWLTNNNVPCHVMKNFEKTFKTAWVHGTYYDNRLCWTLCTDQYKKDRAMNAGRSEAGSWALFVKKFPLPSSEAKAAKRRGLSQ
ncbi:hypothetical protein ARMGADRAFT_1028453 [Armillaria gallica]|uniref:GRF-type domain-containing protein n=1 Tax=Armillaria gallica TaxID=47427 RepID=A0A2H3E5S9_ARMGA|nr:hypothetical protein ARMGADRAFT_1028453 [Armillaria gallica]